MASTDGRGWLVRLKRRGVPRGESSAWRPKGGHPAGTPDISDISEFSHFPVFHGAYRAVSGDSTAILPFFPGYPYRCEGELPARGFDIQKIQTAQYGGVVSTQNTHKTGFGGVYASFANQKISPSCRSAHPAGGLWARKDPKALTDRDAGPVGPVAWIAQALEWFV